MRRLLAVVVLAGCGASPPGAPDAGRADAGAAGADAGTLPDGGSACLTVTGALAVDVRSVVVDRRVTVNSGIAPDEEANGRGTLFLRDQATADSVIWGYTDEASHPVVVIAGTYDVLYQLQREGTGAGGVHVVPMNVGARLATVVLTGDSTIDLDLRTARVNRSFDVNGEAVPDRVTNGSGWLTLRSAAAGEVSWGATTESSHPVEVLLGSYDIYYALEVAGTSEVHHVPVNKVARLAQTLNVAGDTALALDVPVVEVERSFRVNGAPVSNAGVNGVGRLSLRDAAGDDEVAWGETTADGSPVSVIAGRYDVFYELIEEGAGTTQVPANTRARIRRGLQLATSASTTLDVPAVQVDRIFLVNGAPIPDGTVNGDGQLFLRDAETLDEVAWGLTHEPSHPAWIVAGTYDVVYVARTAGSGVGVPLAPRNSKARILAGLSLTLTGTSTLDVRVVTADRELTVNGSAVPDDAVNGQGRLFLRNPTTGDEVPWGSTYTAASPLPVVAGPYDVEYELAVPGTGLGGASVVPANSRRAVATVNLTASGTTPLPLSTVAIVRSLTVNGRAVTDATASGTAQLVLSNQIGHVLLGYSHMTIPPPPALTGRYDLRYQAGAPGSGAGGAELLPRNSNATVGCVQVALP